MNLGNALTLLIALIPAVAVSAQESDRRPAEPEGQALAIHSNLVIVPTLVKTKKGEVVFALRAEDFSVTDDGVPQRVQLDDDANAQPLALVIVAQTGGQGAIHLEDYRQLGTVLEAIIGAVPHRVAIVSFDSHAHLDQNFNEDIDRASSVLGGLAAGDQGAAILDGLTFATSQLAKQPAKYRRAVILLSETNDTGSQTSLDETLRAIDDTNTAIYSFGFSSVKTALKHEGAKLPNPFARTKYSSTPYKAGGCMSREPDADPDAHGSRSIQTLDCASDLVPPLRLARMAYVAAIEGLHRNVPETVAKLTGGEYSGFKDSKSLRQELIAISNDVHNQYVLSFQPPAPHVGFHALSVSLKNRTDFVVEARNAYWIDTPNDHR